MSCKPCLTCCGAMLLCASSGLADATQKIPTLGVPGDGAQPKRVGQVAPRGGGECEVNNGAFDTGTIAPASQWAQDFPFFAQAADNFMFTGDESNPCVITEIIFTVVFFNGPAGGTTPADLSGVRVVIYFDDGSGFLPAGEPLDNGTTTGEVAVDIVVSPASYSFVFLQDDDWEMTMAVGFPLEKNVQYWVAISPMLFYFTEGQTGIGSTPGTDGIPSLQIFGLAGLPDWSLPGGTEQDLAITLNGVKTDDTIGACCFPDGSCIQTADAEECESGGGACSCEGDANNDGEIDPLDSGFVLARFGCPVGTGDPLCDCADQNGDLFVDPLDDGFVFARFGIPCGPAVPGVFQGPGTLCLSADCPLPPPPNDNCEDAITVFDGELEITTLGATDDGPADGADGPCADEFVGHNDVWYDYMAICDGFVTISLCEGTEYDSTLQVYDGASCVLGEQLNCGDDSCDIPGGPSEVHVCSVVTGQELKIRVGSWNFSGGTANIVGDGVLTISCSTENHHDCCDPVGLLGCPGCSDQEVEGCVCDLDPYCCDVQWDEVCVLYGTEFCDLKCK